MLDSNARRPAFDAFFRSLDDTARAVFMADAMTMWEGLQDDEPNRTVSFIDCMENAWDMWRELPSHPDVRLSADDQATKQVMTDKERLAREAKYGGWVNPVDRARAAYDTRRSDDPSRYRAL